MTDFDPAEHQRAIAELLLSEQRFRKLAEATTSALYRLDATATYLVEVYGGAIAPHAREDPPSTSWLIDYIHPDDREATMLAWKRAREEGVPFKVDQRVRRKDGSWGWVLSHAVPLRNEAGEVIEWIGSAMDIDDRKRAEEALSANVTTLQDIRDKQHVLVGELQHRTRNLLAVVRAIASRTFGYRGGHPALEPFLQRLSSLSRVQGLLTGAENERVLLIDVLNTEVEAHGVSHGPRFEANGPKVRLSSHEAQTLALALHELFTNALKYGALLSPTGHLAVTWETWVAANGRSTLSLHWREGGVQMPPGAAERRGQGRELIEDGLRFSLGAKTELAFAEDGVSCHIELPLRLTNAPP